MASVPVPATSNPMRPVLPSRGVAVVKSVMSGDTVVLAGRATQPGANPPSVVFTFERVTAPRLASKSNNNTDDPGAFPAREWLRKTCIGKSITFETRKQGATAGDRVYGLLFMADPNSPEGAQMNLAVESVRRGFATPKVFGGGPEKDDNANDNKNDVGGEADPIQDYESRLQQAYQEAKAAGVGVHAPVPLVRKLKNAGEGFETLELVEKSQKLCRNSTVKCVIEHVFDGSRFRCLVTDPDMESAGLLYASFTLILAGVASPRIGNSRTVPPTETEPFAEEARRFVEIRLLNRELQIGLHGTDNSKVCAVGTVHHPKGSIGVELLKIGFGRVSNWSASMMNPLDVPAFRIAENTAKRTNLGVWHSYKPPTLKGASEILGTVVEVLTGDTLQILPNGEAYDSEDKLKKVSLASVRSPRLGNEKLGKADEPYAVECKERLRVLIVGKAVKVQIHYEREIGETRKENRQFGTVAVGKRDCVGEVLISEGLANTQRHRDADEKSPRYDNLVAAESIAKAAKKGIHSGGEYAKRTINDLTDPRKAKSYSGSLMRAGTLKGIVEYCFNGSRFKILVPSENCHIMFALGSLRCPQPSPPPGAKGQVKAAEPFGDASKRHARLSVLQRTVEIVCNGVTMGGVITGELYVGTGGQRRDFSLELVSAGLGTVDQRKIDYGEAPRVLVDAQTAAQTNKVGIWSLEQKKETTVKTTSNVKSKDEVITIQMSEILSGSHFYFHVVGDEAIKVIDDSMKLFTKENGTSGAPVDGKVGRIVAALFNDGNSKSWYRAKIIEKPQKGKTKVLFIDHGNVATVPVASHLRPLDSTLGTDRIPPVAKEAALAFVHVRPLDEDDGIDAARMLQSVAWEKKLTAHVHCEVDGKKVTTLFEDGNDTTTSINKQMVREGLARVKKALEVNAIANRMVDGSKATKIAADLGTAEEEARKNRAGMWRYGDIGDDDEDE